MREPLKALSKETLIYGLSTVVGRFLNFLLVPFYVNVLRSTADYGIATSLYTYIGFLNVIYPLGLEAAFFRYGSRGEGETPDRERDKSLFTPPFLLIVVFAGLASLMLIVFSQHLVWPVFHDDRFDITPLVPMLEQILKLGAGILFVDALTLLPFAVLRLEQKAVRFALLRLGGILITLTLNYFFIVKFRWGVTGIFWANLWASCVVLAGLLPTIVPRLTGRIDAAVLKTMLPFGLTNVPAYLSSMMVQVIDRPLIQAFLGLGVLGVYQANYRMGFVMMILVSLFEYAWRPFFMRQALKDDAQARLLFARVFTYFMAALAFAFLALSWALPILVTTPVAGHTLLKSTYWGGLPIIPVILLSYVFQGMYTIFIAGIYIKEKNKVLPLVTTAGAAVNVVANLILIPKMGLMGAALATLFAYMTMAAGLYVPSQRAYFIPYDWRRVGIFFFIAGALFLFEKIAAGFLNSPSLFGMTLLRAGLLGVLAVGMKVSLKKTS